MRTKSIFSFLCLIALWGTPATLRAQQDTLTNVNDIEEAKAAMHRATAFMMDSISYRGAFVWSYLPDRSRQWGEIEAPYRTMVWIQAPSTPSVGHLMLDAYHATGDEYYYEQALKIAKVLISVQHPEGGWNYVEDLAGEQQLKEFYRTIGRQAWRLEE